MEKLLNPYDKEHMRLAMLKHEEVFREQVLELHRLYQTQKMLMKNIQIPWHKKQEQPTWDFKKSKEKIQAPALERPKMVDDSELLELTLGPSNNFYNRRKVANAPLSLIQSNSYSGTSLSSSSSNNKQQHHHHEQKMNNSRQGNHQKWRVDNHVPIKSRNHSFLGEIQNGASNVGGEENLRQSRSLNNNDSWHFQVLSLKMT